MRFKMIFFDLDGTLLPMDMDAFVEKYFELLTMKMVEHGYDAKVFMDALLKGIAAMVKNTGECTNGERFWRVFEEHMGEASFEDRGILEGFYEKEFQGTKSCCGYNPKANETIQKLKEKGYPLVLATNPIFPQVATMQRMNWAGIEAKDFELYTVYENFNYSKPNPEYYRELLQRMNVTAQECLMVGNDVSEDMIAQSLGMKVFLMTEWLINPKHEDISRYPNGGFEELMEYIESFE